MMDVLKLLFAVVAAKLLGEVVSPLIGQSLYAAGLSIETSAMASGASTGILMIGLPAAIWFYIRRGKRLQ